MVAVVVVEDQRARARIHQPPGLVIDKKVRREAAAAGAKNAGNFENVMFHLRWKHVCENRKKHYDVDGVVRVRKFILGCGELAGWVVFGIVNIG